MSKLSGAFVSLPPWATGTLALLLAGLIALVDYVTGHDVSMSTFYLVPICWACWGAGRRAGLLLAAVCAIGWLVAETGTGYPYSSRIILYWNTLTLLALYVGAALLVAAFQAAQRHLEQTVQQRTAALQQEMANRERLEQANLQAERLATAGFIAAQTAHEIRNPLGSIALNLDLIEREFARLAEASPPSAEEGRQLLQEIRGEFSRIVRVVDDYLQFARPRSPERRPLAVNALLEKRLAFMLAEFERTRVRLRTEYDPDLPALDADPEQIWEAVLNLIQNGLDAMPAGGELLVGTRREGRSARLRVADTGSGIRPEEQDRIFQPFVSSKRRGTGLGLTIVQQIVSSHGGHVECESGEGRGSTFTLVLPLAGES